MSKILYILFILPLSFIAQEIDFKANASKINIIVGEPTTIEAKFKLPANKVIDSLYFKLSGNGDTLGNNWELWGKSPIKKSSNQSENDYFIEYLQEFTIANFDTGKYEFPPVIAVADTTLYYSNSILLNVQLQQIDNNASIKKIKPIKETTIFWWEYVFNFLNKYVWLILAIIALAFLLFYLIKKRKTTVDKEDELPKIPLEIQLLEKLDLVEKSKYWQNGYFKKHYSELSEIIWAFLEYRYDIKTFEKTSDEILKSLKWTSINEKHLSELSRFFQLSDGVKFAKLKPLEKDNLHAVFITRNLIEEERTDLNKEETILNTENE